MHHDSVWQSTKKQYQNTIKNGVIQNIVMKKMYDECQQKVDKQNSESKKEEIGFEIL